MQLVVVLIYNIRLKGHRVGMEWIDPAHDSLS